MGQGYTQASVAGLVKCSNILTNRALAICFILFPYWLHDTQGLVKPCIG